MIDLAQVLEDIAKDPRCVGYDDALNGMAKMWRKMETENRELKQHIATAKADLRRIQSMLFELKSELEERIAVSKRGHGA
jgi:hypothetical protein